MKKSKGTSVASTKVIYNFQDKVIPVKAGIYIRVYWIPTVKVLGTYVGMTQLYRYIVKAITTLVKKELVLF